MDWMSEGEKSFDGLDIGGREELALDAGRLGDPEAGVGGQKLLPGQGKSSLEQFFKSLGVEGSHFEEHPLAGPDPDVGAGDGLLVAEKRHAAVVDFGDLISDIVDLVF